MAIKAFQWGNCTNMFFEQGGVKSPQIGVFNCRAVNSYIENINFDMRLCSYINFSSARMERNSFVGDSEIVGITATQAVINDNVFDDSSFFTNSNFQNSSGLEGLILKGGSNLRNLDISGGWLSFNNQTITNRPITHLRTNTVLKDIVFPDLSSATILFNTFLQKELIVYNNTVKIKFYNNNLVEATASLND